MSKRNHDGGIVIDIALILLCLAVFSSCLASGLFAKYSAGAPDDPSTARVALWSVDASAGARMEVTAAGSRSVSYPVTVTNSSETAASYDLRFVFDESLAGKIENPRFGTLTPEEGNAFTDTLTFRSAGQLAAASDDPVSVTENLTFTIPQAIFDSLFGGDGTDYDNEIISGATVEVPFTVTLTITQID